MKSTFAEVSERTLRPLPLHFYQRDPHELAHDLLGRDIVRVLPGGQRLTGRILEVEVYGYAEDPASHANTGVPTERTAPMFGEPGSAYVYKIYGMYHCLNVVAPADQRPSALLIRALQPLEGLDQMAKDRGLFDRYDDSMPLTVQKNLLSGPGKICQAMGIDCSFNESLLDGGELMLTHGVPVRGLDALEIGRGSRIGLNPKTVGESAEWPWRYAVRGSKFLSRPL
ncbi:DNA-3-methyladenine glycosylase [Persicimonas caeni]|nr:DNA-3-methyladenine glycosylase [Persicimonas caeni]